MSATPYDSRPDTIAHISRVRDLLLRCVVDLSSRAIQHDLSKLEDPEKEVFDRETPLLRDLEYGSDEYKEALKRMSVALNHHYYVNRHHPEFFAMSDLGELDAREVSDGTAARRMTLLDWIEALMDWKAASERHATGDIYQSIRHNQKRFGLSDDLTAILTATAREMGW